MLGRCKSSRQQQGQAIIFVILFLGVVLLSLVFLYKAGKITSEKMQLQNAADAAAYSVSVTEARDLNFMAYTNRAMVANERLARWSGWPPGPHTGPRLNPT